MNKFNKVISFVSVAMFALLVVAVVVLTMVTISQLIHQYLVVQLVCI